MADTIPWSLELHTLAQRFAQGVGGADGPDPRGVCARNSPPPGRAGARPAAGGGARGCVGIYLPNGCAAVWADYGATISGACLVHLNAAYTR
ncbi:long-chain fatty acid--CoA ligase, partial [Bordetella hinzii]|nr:long-chain fatty acid--CoA ligase [Bordetella hinzii]